MPQPDTLETPAIEHSPTAQLPDTFRHLLDSEPAGSDPGALESWHAQVMQACNQLEVLAETSDLTGEARQDLEEALNQFSKMVRDTGARTRAEEAKESLE